MIATIASCEHVSEGKVIKQQLRNIFSLLMCILVRYITNHLHGLFAGAWDPQTKDPLPVDIPLPIASQGRSKHNYYMQYYMNG